MTTSEKISSKNLVYHNCTGRHDKRRYGSAHFTKINGKKGFQQPTP
jgi:hypothetical protein